MREHSLDPGLLSEGLGALAILGCVVARPVLRPWYSTWGATSEEARQPLPGDELVPNADLQSTRAITIDAPLGAVWPWLLQLGQGRGGLYSYERLENLVGCDMHNAGKILAAHQQLAAGDIVRLTPEGRGPQFVVAEVDPGRSLILAGDEPPTTWSFVLEPVDRRTTRLLVRWRFAVPPGLGNTLIWRVLTDPINFVMERKMLQGIRARAEAMATA